MNEIAFDSSTWDLQDF